MNNDRSQQNTTYNNSDVNREETLLAYYLARQVRDRALGRTEDECLENYPHDVYFIGNLRPRPIADEQDDFLSELINKLAPTTFGAEFELSPQADLITIQVVLSWACYYRIFPTLDQQRSRRNPEEGVKHEMESEKTISNEDAVDNTVKEDDLVEEDDQSELERQQEKENRRAEEESPEITESARGRRRNRRATDSLYIRFRKIPCKALGSVILQRDKASGWSVYKSTLQNALDKETRRAQQVALNDPEHLRTSGSPESRVRVPDESLTSENTYKDFLAKLNLDVVPEWAWKIETGIRVVDGKADTFIPIFEFVNASPSSGHRNNEPFLFDTQAEFKIEEAKVRPFEVELAPQGFRYDRTMWGRGFNCAVEKDAESIDQLFTTHAPIYEQSRYETRSEPEAPFDILATDPVPVLTNILYAMESYRTEWNQVRAGYVEEDPNWEEKYGEDFDRDLAIFEREINAFRRGLDFIRQDSDVRFAFHLTNETFRRLGDYPTKPKTAWRLFQIVFIVSQIPGIAALRDSNSPDVTDRKQVDIIYFPTGGGKTEAYLGTIVFHCFFDRLRGKTAGVTAWTRFPLRLLTLQQTQRMADAIGVAELVRQNQTDPRLFGKDVDPFAVGYLVGSEATPNEILDPKNYKFAKPKHNVIWSQANDSNERQRWKRVVTCPACRTNTVQVDFDSDIVRIIHRCINEKCAFPNGEIPIYIIDNEIYRYLPSVIVGTIDKLAGLGNQQKFAQILGFVTGRCARHGYYAKKCCQKDCEWRDDRRRKLGLDLPSPKGISGPTLFVQDELHLLKEGLGTFDGHYETFTQRLRAEFGQDNILKFIASSATIEAFERQVEHLYGRSSAFARRFPGPGPTLWDSFYARTREYPQRLFIGILPHNKTIFNTMLELIEFYHREIQQLQGLSSSALNPYQGTYQPGTQEWEALLDNYITSLTYFLAMRELDGIHTDLDYDTNGRLRQDGLNPLKIDELTGSTSTADVTKILERLERTANPKDADAVLATSMVSHGVDIDRFNAMIFYGMPRQTAEYIQASSRVGRAHVGLVFTCMHPARERDRSHYAYFNKYHEYLGQLVEPVAINRWATYSIDRTLPGLFMGVLLQLLAYQQSDVNPSRFYRRDHVVKAINAGRITEENFIPLLEDAYLSYVGSGINLDSYRDKIKSQIESFLYDQIIPSQADFVSDAFEPNKPMRSLRDVDEAIQIEIDQDGADWTDRMSRTTS